LSLIKELSQQLIETEWKQVYTITLQQYSKLGTRFRSCRQSAGLFRSVTQVV